MRKWRKHNRRMLCKCFVRPSLLPNFRSMICWPHTDWSCFFFCILLLKQRCYILFPSYSRDPLDKVSYLIHNCSHKSDFFLRNSKHVFDALFVLSALESFARIYIKSPGILIYRNLLLNVLDVSSLVIYDSIFWSYAGTFIFILIQTWFDPFFFFMWFTRCFNGAFKEIQKNFQRNLTKLQLCR